MENQDQLKDVLVQKTIGKLKGIIGDLYTSLAEANSKLELYESALLDSEEKNKELQEKLDKATESQSGNKKHSK